MLLQVAQAFDQAIVIGRMQADRWFVQHIADTDQSAADAGCQADALQFAAAERVGGAIERQVADADSLQELQDA